VKLKPEKFVIVAAAAEGGHSLTAFDSALLKAGIGNINLVRLSSILPAACREEKEDIDFPPGAFVPTAYGAICSEKEGELISAAVGVGFTPDSFGVIMEHAGTCTAEESRTKVEEMIKEAFHNRKLELRDVQFKSVEHRVKKNGAAIAAVALW